VTSVRLMWLGLGLLVSAFASDVEGVFRIPTYGYSIRIPEGLKGTYAPAPAPLHGVRIALNDSGSAFLWVDGGYNSAEQSLSEMLDDVVNSAAEKGSIETKTRSKTRLGTLFAESITVRYKPAGAPEPEIREEVIALRNMTRGPAIVYTIGMISPADKAPMNRKLLDAVARSFHLEPFPK